MRRYQLHYVTAFRQQIGDNKLERH